MKCQVVVLWTFTQDNSQLPYVSKMLCDMEGVGRTAACLKSVDFYPGIPISGKRHITQLATGLQTSVKLIHLLQLKGYRKSHP